LSRSYRAGGSLSFRYIWMHLEQGFHVFHVTSVELGQQGCLLFYWGCLGSVSGFAAVRGRALRPQHSTTLTARPPIAASLYFEDMSAPVWRIVSITSSRLARCWPSPHSAMREALMALPAAIALRSMHGLCTNPPIGPHVRPRLCSMAISAALSTCSGAPPSPSASPAAALGDPTPAPPS